MINIFTFAVSYLRVWHCHRNQQIRTAFLQRLQLHAQILQLVLLIQAEISIPPIRRC